MSVTPSSAKRARAFVLVHAGADRLYDPFRTQIIQRLVGTTERVVIVLVRIMDQQDIESVYIHAPDAVLDRPHDARHS